MIALKRPRSKETRHAVERVDRGVPLPVAAVEVVWR